MNYESRYSIENNRVILESINKDGLLPRTNLQGSNSLFSGKMEDSNRRHCISCFTATNNIFRTNMPDLTQRIINSNIGCFSILLDRFKPIEGPVSDASLKKIATERLHNSFLIVIDPKNLTEELFRFSYPFSNEIEVNLGEIREKKSHEEVCLNPNTFKYLLIPQQVLCSFTDFQKFENLYKARILPIKTTRNYKIIIPINVKMVGADTNNVIITQEYRQIKVKAPNYYKTLKEIFEFHFMNAPQHRFSKEKDLKTHLLIHAVRLYAPSDELSNSNFGIVDSFEIRKPIPKKDEKLSKLAIAILLIATYIIFKRL